MQETRRRPREASRDLPKRPPRAQGRQAGRTEDGRDEPTEKPGGPESFQKLQKRPQERQTEGRGGLEMRLERWRREKGKKEDRRRVQETLKKEKVHFTS